MYEIRSFRRRTQIWWPAVSVSLTLMACGGSDLKRSGGEVLPLTTVLAKQPQEGLTAWCRTSTGSKNSEGEFVVPFLQTEAIYEIGETAVPHYNYADRPNGVVDLRGKSAGGSSFWFEGQSSAYVITAICGTTPV